MFKSPSRLQEDARGSRSGSLNAGLAYGRALQARWEAARRYAGGSKSAGRDAPREEDPAGSFPASPGPGPRP
jgi:hypothetical protein